MIQQQEPQHGIRKRTKKIGGVNYGTSKENSEMASQQER